MNMRHTPGPWTAVADGGSVLIVTAARGNTMRVVDDSPREEAAANARLIAAAPELLAALKEMLSSPTYGNEPSESAVELAIAAIAKAEGR